MISLNVIHPMAYIETVFVERKMSRCWISLRAIWEKVQYNARFSFLFFCCCGCCFNCALIVQSQNVCRSIISWFFFFFNYFNSFCELIRILCEVSKYVRERSDETLSKYTAHTAQHRRNKFTSSFKVYGNVLNERVNL